MNMVASLRCGAQDSRESPDFQGICSSKLPVGQRQLIAVNKPAGNLFLYTQRW
jgi:hypothetical protein